MIRILVAPSFSSLKAKYPGLPICDEPGHSGAKRLSASLLANGVRFEGAPLCSHGHVADVDWLGSFLSTELGRPAVYNVDQTEAAVAGKCGIVFYRDILRLSGGTMGHYIDLWDGRDSADGDGLLAARETWFWRLRRSF